MTVVAGRATTVRAWPARRNVERIALVYIEFEGLVMCCSFCMWKDYGTPKGVSKDVYIYRLCMLETVMWLLSDQRSSMITLLLFFVPQTFPSSALFKMQWRSRVKEVDYYMVRDVCCPEGVTRTSKLE